MKITNIFKKKKPNVIMFFIDGAARQDVLDVVPYYEKLKKECTTFSTTITYAPYSLAAINAIISGMNGNINGVDGYYNLYKFDRKNIFTLTQYLKEAGYHNELDIVLEDAIPSDGFDKIRAFGADVTKNIDLIERHSEILTQLKNKEPFFVFLDYNKIALSLILPVLKKYNDFSEEFFKNKKKNFDNLVRWVKESGEYLEALLAHIKKIGLYDDSIIIIFNDHGCSI